MVFDGNIISRSAALPLRPHRKRNKTFALDLFYTSPRKHSYYRQGAGFTKNRWGGSNDW
jgi:hypothetical protein